MVATRGNLLQRYLFYKYVQSLWTKSRTVGDSNEEMRLEGMSVSTPFTPRGKAKDHAEDRPDYLNR